MSLYETTSVPEVFTRPVNEHAVSSRWLSVL